MIGSSFDSKGSKHPCYSFDAHHQYARMHLPVAPMCNIQCNYCNRKYDCVNESRPGVTSEVLTPEQALEKVRRVAEALPNLTVIGIAGPGDALADWDKTKKTIQLVKQEFPEMIFCLSTNGLLLPRHGAEIVELGVQHVTVTVNTLDPAVGARIYRHVIWDGKRYEGEVAAAMLLTNQQEGIRYLAEQGVLVKVNLVMVSGLNDEQIPAVVGKVKALGASLTNIMPLIPAPGSAFAHYPQTSQRDVGAMRDRCQEMLPQMRHCQQCRADAIGLLTEDRSAEFRTPPATGCSGGGCATERSGAAAYRVAVTTRSGVLVDQHFGHAQVFQIYETDGVNQRLVEQRSVEQYCTGSEACFDLEDRKNAIVAQLQDCAAVVSLRTGHHAKERLKARGILAVESCASIKDGLALAVERIKIKEAV